MKSGLFRVQVLLFLWLSCMAAVAQGVDQPTGTIAGQVLGADGLPLAVGVVSFFTVENGPPMDQGVVRRVPEMVVRIGQEGRFTADLPAGRYYLGFLQRERGRGPGPPRPGEKFFFALDEAKALKIYLVTAGQSTNTGPVSGAIPDLSLPVGSYVTFQGKVSYEDGRPFPGAYVTAKKNLDSPRPQFISGPTDASGSYRLRLPPGEPFYLVALENLRGGRPRIGSHAGGYGGRSPIPTAEKRNIPPAAVGPEEGYAAGRTVSGKAGEVISGLDITVYEVLDPEQVRNEMLKKAGAQMPDEQPDKAAPK